jgi:GNAT superfamily N-acetyltransferase
VRDDAQGRGLGTILGGKAVEVALARGCSEMVAYGSAGNPRLLRLLSRLGLRGHARYEGASVTVSASLGVDSAGVSRPELSIVPPLP